MPNAARTHQENRHIICILCFKKDLKARPLTDRLRGLIETHALQGIDFQDERLPDCVCLTCDIALYEYEKGIFSKQIVLHDHSKIPQMYPSTRSQSSEACACCICEKGRTNILPSAKSKRGRPPTTDQSLMTTKAIAVKLCSKCLSMISRGATHNCTMGNRIKNAVKLLNESPARSTNTPGKILSSALMEKLNGNNSVQLPVPNKSKLLNVSVNQSTSNISPISAKKIGSIQSSMSLSQRQTLKLATELRGESGNLISPNLKADLRQTDHQLQALFQSQLLDFVEMEKNKVKKHVSRPVVCVHSFDEFIERIMEIRGMNLDETMIKLGIDGGGGFLKFCLSLYSKYIEAPGKFKDTGVKRVFIIAICPDTQENYSNLKSLWIRMGIHSTKYSYIVASDLKILNILLGLMSHGANFPCCWCEAPRNNLGRKANPRTFKSICDNYSQMIDKPRNLAKNYFNCVHSPIIRPQDNNVNMPIIESVVPPELHLLTGPVNKMYKCLEERWPEASNWLKSACVEREALHGGCFTGNSAMKLLRSVDKLDSVIPAQHKSFVAAFSTFYDVSIFYELIGNCR